MTMRIAINGFGRIGRSVLRALSTAADRWPGLEIVAINDIAGLERWLNGSEHSVDTDRGVEHEHQALGVSPQEIGECLPAPVERRLEILRHEADRIAFHLVPPASLHVENGPRAAAEGTVIQVRDVRVQHPAIHPATITIPPNRMNDR